MSEASVGSRDILAESNTDKREEIVEMLKKAYWMEIETVMSYVANSVNPDGVRAQEIRESLEKDIQEELGHAQQFAARIKELYGVVPGSEEFTAEQSFLQPPGRPGRRRPRDQGRDRGRGRSDRVLLAASSSLPPTSIPSPRTW